jgi:hypothetical protein
MDHDAIVPNEGRAPYARPVIENLGSLRELTAGSASTYNPDSGYGSGSGPQIGAS